MFRDKNTVDRNGYPAVYIPEHPKSYDDGMVYVHHIIAMEKYGDVPDGCHVHHIDGDKWNWDKSNLVLMDAKEHISLHHKVDRVILTCEYCDETFEVYPSMVERRRTCSPKCSSRAREKIDWPAVGKLKRMVEDKSYVQVGRELGVSNNAVKKRIKNHG